MSILCHYEWIGMVFNRVIEQITLDNGGLYGQGILLPKGWLVFLVHGFERILVILVWVISLMDEIPGIGSNSLVDCLICFLFKAGDDLRFVDSTNGTLDVSSPFKDRVDLILGFQVEELLDLDRGR